MKKKQKKHLLLARVCRLQHQAPTSDEVGMKKTRWPIPSIVIGFFLLQNLHRLLVLTIEQKSLEP